MRRLLPVCPTLVLCLAAGALAAPRSAPLDLDPARQPWTLQPVFRVRQPAGPGLETACGLLDIDGDGSVELVTADQGKIMAFDLDHDTVKPRWQHNVDSDWRHDPGAIRLAVAVDLDGDGVREVPYTIERADHGAWRYRVFDPASGTVTADAPLPVFDSPRREPWWDGFYHVAGVLEDPAGDGRPGVVLVREVMYDAFPRGLVVVDAATGRQVWEWRCGPNPVLGQTTVADLDGDGRPEVVVYGGAPGNLGGRQVNGTSDDRTHLFVVSDRGETLVDRVIGPERFGGELRVADLDGDGRREIITYSHNGNPGVNNVLAVWDGPTGVNRAQVRGVAAFAGLAILAGPRAGTSWLVCGSTDGTVRRLLFDGASLTQDRQRISDLDECTVLGTVPLLADRAPQVLVDAGDGANLVVLDGDLATLAVLPDALSMRTQQAGLWPRPGGPDLVLLSQRDWRVLAVTHRSLWARYGRDAWRPLAGGGLLLAAFGGGLLAGRRVRRRRRSGVVAGQPDRHRLRTVLQDLQETDHGTLGVTRGLRRVVMLATAGGGLEAPAVRSRFTEVCAEVRESLLLRLQGILAACGEAGFAPETCAAAGGALKRCFAALDTLVAGDHADPGTLAEFQRNQELVEATFGQLRREIVAYFTTDPARMLRGMLLVREVDLGRAGVAAALDAPAACPCLVDGTDLRFVLDNLVDNAVRAMVDAPVRELKLTVAADGKDVTVTVRDTGPGVPPDLRERIFSGRHSSRRGGGLGLARSRRLLARWNAELELPDPQPDAGALFRITLPGAGL